MQSINLTSVLFGSAKRFSTNQRNFIAISMMFALYAVIMFIGSIKYRNGLELTLLLLCTFAFVLLYFRSRFLKWFNKTAFVVSTLFYFNLLFIISGGFHGYALFFFVLSYLSLISVSDHNNMHLIFPGTAVNIIAFVLIDNFIPDFIEPVAWSYQLLNWVVFIFILIPSGFIVNALKSNYNESAKIIQNQKEEIEVLFENLNSSVRYASNIQKAIFPKAEDLKEILPQHFVFFVPREIVSGDFYWIEKIDNKIVIAIADCTGHGVPGAFMSMLGISLLNEIVLDQKILKTNEILTHLREKVKQNIPNAYDGMDIAVVVIDRDRMEMDYAGANAPLYCFRDGIFTEFKPNKQPVGKFPKEKEFLSQTIEIKQNDIYYLFSDGFRDQIGGPEDKKFMTKHFVELLAEIHSLPLNEQKAKLGKTFEDWKNYAFKNKNLTIKEIEDIYYQLDFSELHNRENRKELRNRILKLNGISPEKIIALIQETYSEQVAHITEKYLAEIKNQVDDVLVFGFRI